MFSPFDQGIGLLNYVLCVDRNLNGEGRATEMTDKDRISSPSLFSVIVRVLWLGGAVQRCR